MRPRLQQIAVSKWANLGWLIGVLVICCPAQLSLAKSTGTIVCREELSSARRNELAGRLRLITGWSALKFDDGGTLRLGLESSLKGSSQARDLLNKALAGPNVLVLEDASNRPDVVFARVVEGYWKEGAAGKPPVYVVLIDFADFDHLMGDQQALNAFNVGWGVLHEIDHVVNDSADAEVLGRAGECETHLNEMRRELNLPRRTDYFFTYFPHAEESEFVTRFVRLAFDEEKPGSSKRRRYWLIWDATLVGGLSQTKQVASRR